MKKGNAGETEEQKKGEALTPPPGASDDFKAGELLDKRLKDVEQTLREEKKFAELFDRAADESATMKEAMGKHIAEAIMKHPAVRLALAAAVKEEPQIIQVIEEAVATSDRKWYHKYLRAFGGKVKVILIFVGGIASTLFVDWAKKKLGL